LHSRLEPAGDIGVHLYRHFAAAALRLQDAGQGDECAAYSRISSA
jgi:hypothetical protein